MRSTLVAAALLTALFTAGPARAQTRRPDVGLDLGLRIGYAIPFGDIDGGAGDGLASTLSGAVPLILEAGYRVTPVVTLGVLLQYAFAQVNDASNGCGNAGVSCSASVVQLGFEGIYYIPFGSPFVPWAGLATGYEWANLDASGTLATGSFAARGWQFLTLQAGGDVLVAPRFALGPFISFSIGRYGTGSTEINGTTTSRDIANPAEHEWLQIGARGTFGL